MPVDKLQLADYIKKARDDKIDMDYISWDMRDWPDRKIGYTILSKNEYCGYRGEYNPWKMLAIIEGTNHPEWFMLYSRGKECFCDCEEDTAMDETIQLIEEFYDKQDAMGFLLCLKITKEDTCQIESRIYNVAKLDYMGYIKTYFERALTWYLFAVPQPIIHN